TAEAFRDHRARAALSRPFVEPVRSRWRYLVRPAEALEPSLPVAAAVPRPIRANSVAAWRATAPRRQTDAVVFLSCQNRTFAKTLRGSDQRFPVSLTPASFGSSKSGSAPGL